MSGADPGRARRLRLLYLAEGLVLLGALILGAFPGVISAAEVADVLLGGSRGDTSFCRLQLTLSMCAGLPLLALIVAGGALAGGERGGLWARRVHGLLGVGLLLPTALAALVMMGVKVGPAYLALPVPLGLVFAALPLGPAAGLLLAGRAPAAAWALGAGGGLLGALLNLAFGFWAFVEIGTWV